MADKYIPLLTSRKRAGRTANCDKYSTCFEKYVGSVCGDYSKIPQERAETF